MYKTEENSILKKGAKLEPKRVNIGVPRSYLVKHGGNGSFMVGSERVNDFFKDYEIVFGSDFDGIMGLFWDYFGITGLFWDYFGIMGLFSDYFGITGLFCDYFGICLLYTSDAADE